MVVLWRREPSRIQYEWLNVSWPVCPSPPCSEGARGEEILRYQAQLNETQRALDELVRRLLKPTEVLAYEAHVQVSSNYLVPEGYYEHWSDQS